jgi:hypothetical protein
VALRWLWDGLVCQILTRLQFPHVRDITVGHWPELAVPDRCYRQGASVERSELHLVSRFTFVNADYRADIAGFKTFGGQVRGQHDAIMFLDTHQRYKGYEVIRGAQHAIPTRFCQARQLRDCGTERAEKA